MTLGFFLLTKVNAYENLLKDRTLFFSPKIFMGSTIELSEVTATARCSALTSETHKPYRINGGEIICLVCRHLFDPVKDGKIHLDHDGNVCQHFDGAVKCSPSGEVACSECEQKFTIGKIRGEK